ncbi:AMP nucleosidase [bacterium]|nr:MAG: AMP nucleosidase [bacterium]
MTTTFSILPDNKRSEDDLNALVSKACDVMEELYDQGYYPKMTVKRSWSEHNPVIEGEFAKPKAYRWYLTREIKKLVQHGAEVVVDTERKAVPLNDPLLLDALDEEDWDITQKKLFLFKAERIDISLNRLEHYTGTGAEDFQRNILFTNYDMHVEVFREKYPDCVKPSRKGVQMPAYHHKLPNNEGLTLINIGVGPSNAKTCSDHIAVLRPDLMIMVGHCGGLRNHQEIGDFVLASGYMRADGVLDDLLPLHVPIAPTFTLNLFLQEALRENKLNYRIGTVYTTMNRNWEFSKKKSIQDIHLSRSIAIDMESATLATNGFRYRIPHATLLCVSDKPLHGKPKLSGPAQSFYENSKKLHLDVVIRAIELAKQQHPTGLPTSSIRALNEPLMGGPDA